VPEVCGGFLIFYQLQLAYIQRWALASGKARKVCKSVKKKSAKKGESAERERKKARIGAFSPTHSGNLVLEPKATWQGGKQDVHFSVLKRQRGRDTGERRSGRDRGVDTEGEKTGEETEGKRQRGEMSEERH
jgi:hypothetical protein